jgi:hypothetical protein
LGQRSLSGGRSIAGQLAGTQRQRRLSGCKPMTAYDPRRTLSSRARGVSVHVTLIFLLFQMRQTDRTRRSLVQQSRTAMQVDAIFRNAEPQFTEVTARAVDPEAQFSDTDVTTVLFISLSYFRSMENSFIQQHAGINPISMQSDLASLRAFMRTTTNRVAWRFLRSALSGRFREPVDGLVRQTSIVPNASALRLGSPRLRRKWRPPSYRRRPCRLGSLSDPHASPEGGPAAGRRGLCTHWRLATRLRASTPGPPCPSRHQRAPTRARARSTTRLPACGKRRSIGQSCRPAHLWHGAGRVLSLS